MNNINNYLAELRCVRGYSMSEVTEATGITNSRLSRIENDKSSPRFDDVIVLLQFYNSSIIDASKAIGLIHSSANLNNTELLNSEEIKHIQNEIDFLIHHKKGIDNEKNI